MTKSGKKDAGARIRKALKTGKVPKDIGGIKLSKPLRQSAEALIAEAKKPETLRKLAGGIAMAITVAGAKRQGAAAERAAHPAPPVPPVPPVPPIPPIPPVGAGGTTTGGADQIVDALADAARRAIDQFLARGR